MTTKELRVGTKASVIAMIAVIAVSAVSAQTKIKPGFNLFSTEQDVEIGRQSAIEVERQLPILRDRSANAYVTAVGKRLAAKMPGTGFTYQFKIVNTSDINAFALPGGFMYLNRGLIEAAKNEGQLAGVMAHEMSHVALRHGTNQASKAYMGQAGLGILGGLMGKEKGSPNKVISAVGGFGLNALFLKFSRTDEEQADIVGAQAMAKAGYNPQDMVDFFETLRAEQSHDPSKLEQYFSSHPAPQDRAARIRKEMAMLRIQPSEPVGGFRQAKATLMSKPAARSMQQIAKNQPATLRPREYPENASSAVNIEAPSATFRTFEQRNRNFSIDYPSNWNATESADGLGITLSPPGGVVNSGNAEGDLIYGVVVNHYAPFLNEDDSDDGQFSFMGSPSEPGGRDLSRTDLAEAMNDLVGQIVRTNPSLELVPDSQRTETIDGGAALSLVLAGRSAVTKRDEHVTVFARELSDDHIVYALFIAPGQKDARLRGTFDRMLKSLRVNDEARHR